VFLIRLHTCSNFLPPEFSHVKENVEVIQAVQILICGPHEATSSYPAITGGSFPGVNWAEHEGDNYLRLVPWFRIRTILLYGKQNSWNNCCKLKYSNFLTIVCLPFDRLCGLEVRVRFPALPDFLRSSGSGTGSTQLREHN
jgi:hypothetical protein